jgi:predicted phage tail protein
MQTVYLVGAGLEQFGIEWTTRCKNIKDIFKLIECQREGFREYLLEAHEADVGFEIRVGKDLLLEQPEELLLSNLTDEDIVITEVPSGGKGGFKKILAAIAIIAVVSLTGGFGAGGWAVAAEGGLTLAGNIVLGIATNLALAGISEILAPGPETDGKENDGYLFNGPDNTIQQGLPVPVAYGEVLVGGKAIASHFQLTPFNTIGYVNYGTGTDSIDRTSAGITAEQYQENSSINYIRFN